MTCSVHRVTAGAPDRDRLRVAGRASTTAAHQEDDRDRESDDGSAARLEAVDRVAPVHVATAARVDRMINVAHAAHPTPPAAETAESSTVVAAPARDAAVVIIAARPRHAVGNAARAHPADTVAGTVARARPAAIASAA